MIKIKSSRKEQEKVDTIQPYIGKGYKKNYKFEQFHGSIKEFGKNRTGEAVEKEIDWKEPSKRKYYT